MIVLDASAMIAILVSPEADQDLITTVADDICVPHLIDIEVLSVLRGLTLARKLPIEHAERARADYAELTMARFDTPPLTDRIWQLRNNFTPYDATYIALAEVLECPLVTCDRKLVSTLHRAEVVVLPRHEAGTS